MTKYYFDLVCDQADVEAENQEDAERQILELIKNGVEFEIYQLEEV